MGEVSAAVIDELSQGIQSVISDEYVEGKTYLSVAEQILESARNIQHRIAEAGSLGNGTYKTTRDVVNAAAKQAQDQFQANHLKFKIKEMFKNIRRDHSSIEDDELRALLQEGFQDFSSEIIDMFTQYYKSYLEVYNANTKIYSTVMAQTNIAEATQIMSKGYQILTKIGESIRGTQILYEVQLSIGTKGSQRTGYFTLEELMQYTTVNYYNGAMTLRVDTAALNKAATNGEINLFKWDQSYIDRYQNYTKKVIENQLIPGLQNWDKNIGLTTGQESQVYINKGNVTESFRVAATSIYNRATEATLGKSLDQILSADDHALHYMIHTTLKNTTSYWQGPDFEADIESLFSGLIGDDSAFQAIKDKMGVGDSGTVEVQEKVNSATFTNLSSLITQLQNTINSLRRLDALGDKVKSRLSTTTDGLDAEVDEAIWDLVKQFLPGAS